MILGRPVKIALTREEVFYCHRGRHPVLMRFKTGVKDDGTITAMHLKTFIDGGAYGSYGVASTFYTGALQTVTYRIPRYRFEACRMFTNKPPCGPKRGHGTPQPRFGQEVQLDKIAEALALDPAQLRLKIAEQPDTVTANFMHVQTIGLSDCIKSVVNRSDWARRFRKMPHGKGRAPGGRPCARPAGAGRGEEAGRPEGPPRLRREPRVRRGGPGEGRHVPGGRDPRRGGVRDVGNHGLLHAAALPRPLQRGRR